MLQLDQLDEPQTSRAAWARWMATSTLEIPDHLMRQFQHESFMLVMRYLPLPGDPQVQPQAQPQAQPQVQPQVQPQYQPQVQPQYQLPAPLQQTPQSQFSPTSSYLAMLQPSLAPRRTSSSTVGIWLK